jgi:hypothetical protein
MAMFASLRMELTSATGNEDKFGVEICLRSDLTVFVPLWLGSVDIRC